MEREVCGEGGARGMSGPAGGNLCRPPGWWWFSHKAKLTSGPSPALACPTSVCTRHLTLTSPTQAVLKPHLLHCPCSHPDIPGHGFLEQEPNPSCSLYNPLLLTEATVPYKVLNNDLFSLPGTFCPKQAHASLPHVLYLFTQISPCQPDRSNSATGPVLAPESCSPRSAFNTFPLHVSTSNVPRSLLLGGSLADYRSCLYNVCSTRAGDFVCFVLCYVPST